MPGKHSAKVVCYEGSVWISPRQFWGFVRDDIVEYLSEPPLTGRFKGQPADFLVTRKPYRPQSGVPGASPVGATLKALHKEIVWQDDRSFLSARRTSQCWN